MTGHDDTPQGFDDLDRLLDGLLAGDEPTAAMPAWGADVALLVRVAQAPAHPDELAAEEDLVHRMSEVRRSVLARGAAVGPDDQPVPATVPSGLATVTGLSDRRPGRAGDRGYRAKHAAARLERSRHPAVRTVGRAIAMKAAAVTTAAVIGAAAAAAATTGIVASVVVPALSDGPDEPAPTPVTTATPDRPREGPSADATEDADHPTGVAPSAQPGCLLPATCAQDPLTAPPPATAPPATPPASAPTTVPADPPDEPSPTSTPGTPATTEISETPATTEPPPTTTVPEEPPSDPPPGTLSLPEQAEGQGRGRS